MRIIYMGTPEFAAIALAAIVKEHEVVAVVTQPDKPQGRNSAVWLYQYSCVIASEIPWRGTNRACNHRW